MVCLDGTNYYKWKCKMKDLLFVKNLHLPIFSATKPESKTTEEWFFENQQVCAFIRQWVGEKVLNHIVNETDAKVLWNKLETLYASKKTLNNKLFLIKQAKSLMYKEGSSISDHLSEFQGCFNQLFDMGVKLDDKIIALWLVNTLPDSWETFMVSLIDAAPNGIVTLEYVKSGILNEEMRRRTQGKSPHSKILMIERGRSKHTSQGHNNRGRSRSKSRPRHKDLECHFCGKTGHIKRYCYKWKKENYTSNGNHQKKGN